MHNTFLCAWGPRHKSHWMVCYRYCFLKPKIGTHSQRRLQGKAMPRRSLELFVLFPLLRSVTIFWVRKSPKPKGKPIFLMLVRTERLVDEVVEKHVYMNFCHLITTRHKVYLIMYRRFYLHHWCLGSCYLRTVSGFTLKFFRAWTVGHFWLGFNFVLTKEYDCHP